MAGIDVDELADALDRYDRYAVFAQVEEDRLETFPEAFRDGSFLWKDVEWIVRWYCRRPLAGHDRSAERALRENSMEDIGAAIDAVLDADSIAERVRALTDLEGVDVPVASAILQFIEPENFAAIDRRTWRALVDGGALGERYPEPVRIEDYETYLRECHGLAAMADRSLVDIAHALWVLDVERHPPDQ